MALIDFTRSLDFYVKFTDRYGAEVRVQDSSAASGPRCWLFIKGGRVDDNHGAAHLTEDQVREVIRGLQAWLDAED